MCEGRLTGLRVLGQPDSSLTAEKLLLAHTLRMGLSHTCLALLPGHP